MAISIVKKCVGICDYQDEFINNVNKEGHEFNLSKFLQTKLDEYMKFYDDYKQIMNISEKEVIKND